jgi:hypothetical protein
VPTTATDFYLSPTANDQTFGTDVRKLTETSPATDNTTICAHPSAAGTTVITVDPYSSRSTTGDATTLFGWAFNNGGADGLGSTSTVKRRIPASHWNFNGTLTLPAPAALGSITAFVAMYVYRVATGGGARTLLGGGTGTAVSNTATNSGIAAASTVIGMYVDLPEIVVQPGETLMVSFTMSSTQVGTPAVGTTVANNIIFVVGGGTNFGHINLAGGPPNSLFISALTGATQPAGTEKSTVTKYMTSTSVPSGSLKKTPALFKAGAVTSGGGLVKTPLKKFATGNVTLSAGVLVKVDKKLAGSTTAASGGLIRTPIKVLTSSTASSSTLARKVVKFFTGGVTPAGTNRNTIVKHFTGTLYGPAGSGSAIVRKVISWIIVDD